MPSPNKRFLEIGMWDKSDTPTKAEYHVLCHLAAHPGSRAIIHALDDYRAGLTSCEVTGAHGLSVRGKMTSLRFGVLINYGVRLGPWVEVDEDAEPVSVKGARVYKITEQGWEAIAQYEARLQFETKSLELAKRLLKNARISARALIPK